uniref:Uncharacterized protein n=1 Tax=Amphilophus citrinellus TaxID=61819 RepID=A0A3Q0RR91_AMPCI
MNTNRSKKHLDFHSVSVLVWLSEGQRNCGLFSQLTVLTRVLSFRVQRMTQLLKEKEELLRKLKETLRKSQQEGEETCKCQPCVCVFVRFCFVSLMHVYLLIKSIKNRELLVSSQQAEISKWKNRAIKLKVRSKDLESPRKLLDSPKASLLNSPKSRFFDMGGSSRTLSRNCPKQFFDNSSLGSIPGKLRCTPGDCCDSALLLISGASFRKQV